MQRKNNKKGFTLAELLIVVAIIAVLVAIAVPLFVGALNNAKEAAEDANIRSLRSYGATYILMMQDDDKFYATCYDEETGLLVSADKGFQLEATMSDEGAFTITNITKVSTTGENKVEGTTVKAVIMPSALHTAKAG